MVITTEPKVTFQKNEDQAKSFREVVDMPVFHEALHKAISEFVLKGKPTAEELEGIRRFLDVLLNLAEKDVPQERQPFMRSISATTQPQPKK